MLCNICNFIKNSWDINVFIVINMNVIVIIREMILRSVMMTKITCQFAKYIEI